MQILKFKCPGCGFTSAVYQFLNGKIMRAVEFNFSILFFIPILIIEPITVLSDYRILEKIRFVSYLVFLVSLLTVYIIRIIIFLKQ